MSINPRFGHFLLKALIPAIVAVAAFSAIGAFRSQADITGDAIQESNGPGVSSDQNSAGRQVKNRSVRTIDDPRWRQQLSMPELVQRSTVVVVGTTRHGIAQRSADGQTFTTDYQVVLEQVIKGEFKQGETITVSLPGGVGNYEKGTVEVVVAPNFPKLQSGRKYALFLNAAADATRILTPTNGPQGMYELPTNGAQVRHYGRSLLLPPDDPNAPSVEAFLKAVRSYVGPSAQPASD